jgi:hypothetical protein
MRPNVPLVWPFDSFVDGGVVQDNAVGGGCCLYKQIFLIGLNNLEHHSHQISGWGTLSQSYASDSVGWCLFHSPQNKHAKGASALLEMRVMPLDLKFWNTFTGSAKRKWRRPSPVVCHFALAPFSITQVLCMYMLYCMMYICTVWLVLLYSMTHNLSTIEYGLRSGVEACPKDRWSSTSTLLFFSQKETLVYSGIRPAKLSYIFSYVANKAIAGCTIMKKHRPHVYFNVCYHVQISRYFVYSFIYTCILFVMVTGIIFKNIYVCRLIDVLLHSELYGEV